MELDQEIRGFVEESDRIFGSDYGALSMSEQREIYNEWCRTFSAPIAPDVVSSELYLPRSGAARDGTVRAMLQRPRAAPTEGKKLPVVIYYHGGGWILGSPETHEMVTAEIVRQVRVAVLSVDYRLAPEHPFPAAFDDAYAALVWAGRSGATVGLDPARIAVAGDSAGGNLAAAVALASRERGGPRIALQALVYPVLKAARRSVIDNSGEDGIAGFVRAYAGGADIAHVPYAMPLSAADLTGLPPAFIAAAGIDVLKEDAEDFAAALSKSGVPAEFRCAPGLTHSYLRCIHFSRAAYLEFAALCQALQRALGTGTAAPAPRRSGTEKLSLSEPAK